MDKMTITTTKIQYTRDEVAQILLEYSAIFAHEGDVVFYSNSYGDLESCIVTQTITKRD